MGLFEMIEQTLSECQSVIYVRDRTCLPWLLIRTSTYFQIS